MREILENLIKAIVDKPDEVSVDEMVGEQTTVYELRVAKEDMGKVIGRSGRNANALRTLLAAAGMKLGKRFVMEIIE
jgi:hypothetical protein